MKCVHVKLVRTQPHSHSKSWVPRGQMAIGTSFFPGSVLAAGSPRSFPSTLPPPPPPSSLTPTKSSGFLKEGKSRNKMVTFICGFPYFRWQCPSQLDLHLGSTRTSKISLISIIDRRNPLPCFHHEWRGHRHELIQATTHWPFKVTKLRIASYPQGHL